MSKTLVIVESAGKIKKISQYLGNEYIVKASFGHVQDLDKKTLSIDVQNNFKPLYINSPDKLKIIKELKDFAKSCKEVIIASDGDREGEAIAYSLANVLKLDNPKRIVFHEITKNALLKAINNPTTINNDMVHAQQARRLLDRLVGYEISPILWKYLIFQNTAQSAGRVQSVAVKIIIDKEKEIEKSISEPYFKTIGEFTFNEIKLSGVLEDSNKQYHFETKKKAINFLELINKKTIFIVKSVDNKLSIRRSSPPFITSTLQQEASTKLHFPVKKTMDVAQKLYEAGLITYMRTDSPNISKDAIKACEEYIIKNYGEEYSEPKNYQSKGSSQDAHECIRPTNIEKAKPEDLEGDLLKLYSLIWKRTIASQMSNARVNVQTIKIDAINEKSILLFEQQCYFVSKLENIEFDGYLIVYDNRDDEEKESGKLLINPNDKVSFNKIRVIEEYTKPPLRYNEALLVKYLEKNGIGRPSTYASIISKIIERNYVEIKNIDGIEKMSLSLELDKKFKIKENEKKVIIGKEQKKLVPTEMGKLVNNFLQEHFNTIMDINYTANFETYLDKISIGKANWVTVLKTFYDEFHPIVEKLSQEAKTKKEKIGSSSDILLGSNNGNEIYKGSGKYGPYVKIVEEDKARYASLKDISLDDVTLEDAIKLLEFPRLLGKIGKAHITLNKGPYGYYLKYNGNNYSVKDKELEEITLDYAKELIQSGGSNDKTFKIKDKTIYIKNGEYGYYLQIVSGKSKQNISIPTKYDVSKIKIDEVMEIIAKKNGTSKG